MSYIILHRPGVLMDDTDKGSAVQPLFLEGQDCMRQAIWMVLGGLG